MKLIGYLFTVRLLQKAMEINTQSMDQLREILFGSFPNSPLSAARLLSAKLTMERYRTSRLRSLRGSAGADARFWQARNGHAEVSWRCPLLGEQRKTYARIELFRF